jgi:hypothetical protein
MSNMAGLYRVAGERREVWLVIGHEEEQTRITAVVVESALSRIQQSHQSLAQDGELIAVTHQRIAASWALLRRGSRVSELTAR